MKEVDKILAKWEEQNKEIKAMIEDLKKQVNGKGKASASK